MFKGGFLTAEAAGGGGEKGSGEDSAVPDRQRPVISSDSGRASFPFRTGLQVERNEQAPQMPQELGHTCPNKCAAFTALPGASCVLGSVLGPRGWPEPVRGPDREGRSQPAR